ncbi:MSP domain-containing protein [Psidium guajava]|nr:MSP domain-containing protein [Psidium guajava]
MRTGLDLFPNGISAHQRVQSNEIQKSLKARNFLRNYITPLFTDPIGWMLRCVIGSQKCHS